MNLKVDLLNNITWYTLLNQRNVSIQAQQLEWKERRFNYVHTHFNPLCPTKGPTYWAVLDAILINRFSIVCRNSPCKLIVIRVWWHDHTIFSRIWEDAGLFWVGSLGHGVMFTGCPISKPYVILSSKPEVVCCLWLQSFQDVWRICTEIITLFLPLNAQKLFIEICRYAYDLSSYHISRN